MCADRAHPFDGQPPADSFWDGVIEDPATDPDLAPTGASIKCAGA